MNIKQFFLEDLETNEELPFDPEIEITEEDWAGMKKVLEERREKLYSLSIGDMLASHYNARFYFLEQVRWMLLLFPERAEELNLDERAWSTLLVERIESGIAIDDTRYLSTLKLAYPKKFKEACGLGVINLDNRWGQLKRTAQDELVAEQKGQYSFFINDLLFTTKILWPERSGELFPTEVEWDAMILRLKSSQGDVFRFIDKARALAFIAPQKWQQTGLGSGKRLHSLREELHGLQAQGAYAQAARWAAFMKIIAAENIEVGDEGVKITMPPLKGNYKERVAPMPEIREF